MHDLNIFGARCAQVFAQLVLLEFNRDLDIAFCWLELDGLALVDCAVLVYGVAHESNIIEQCVVFVEGIRTVACFAGRRAVSAELVGVVIEGCHVCVVVVV